MRVFCTLSSLLLVFCTTAQITEVPAVYSGDVNQDGINDILVKRSIKIWDSTLLYGGYRTMERSVHLYLGTVRGLDTTEQWTLREMDNQGFPFYFDLSHDVDKDGYNDILCMAYLTGKNNKAYKAALVYYHTAAGYSELPVIITPELPERKDWDGYFTDYNGDGYVDIIVNTYGFVPNLSIRWPTNFKANVIYGNGKGFDKNMISVMPEIQAMEMKTGYDFDGNKLKDLFITGPGFSGTGNDHIFLLLTQKNQPPLLKDWIRFETRAFSNEQYKYGLLGDINGDGKDDVSVEKQESKKNVRKNKVPGFTISIYTGADSGLATQPFESFAITDWKGFQKIGDIDGDGFDDLLTKCLNCETGYINTYSTTDLGSFLIYRGSKTGLVIDTTYSNIFLQMAKDKSFSIFPVGDINGDNIEDLIINRSNGQYIIYGNTERKFQLRKLNSEAFTASGR